MKDFYQVLEVNPNSTQEEIKTAFRRLSKQHHADVGGDDAKMREILEAYEVLGDLDTRILYDKGEWKGPKPNQKQQAISELCKLFLVITEKVYDLEHTDLVAIVRQELQAQLKRCVEEGMKLESKAIRLESAASRFKVYKGFENFAASSFLSQAEQMRKMRSGFENQEQLFKEMLDVLKNFKYKFEEGGPQQPFMSKVVSHYNW